MRATVYPIVFALSSLGFISIVNGQDARCSLTCRDEPSSTAGGGLLHLKLSSAGESLQHLVEEGAGSNAAGQVYNIFGGNETASLRSDYPSEAPDSRFFIGRRKFLRVCTNSCSKTQALNEKSAAQHRDTFSSNGQDALNLAPLSTPTNGISRGETKTSGKSDANSTKKFGTQKAKKSVVAKHGHAKSSRISHRKM